MDALNVIERQEERRSFVRPQTFFVALGHGFGAIAFVMLGRFGAVVPRSRW